MHAQRWHRRWRCRRGGYNQTADVDYLNCFRGWEAIDVFCYFGHNRVSMPPGVWVSACHQRGVPCLGTLIFEGGAAAGDVTALLSNIDSSVEKLCALCEHFGFDGWLINLEAPIAGGAAGMDAVHELLAVLTICLKQRVGEQALVLFYDSLDAQGKVRYANALSPANKPCFDACDGLFTNYWWGAEHLAQSAPPRHCRFTPVRRLRRRRLLRTQHALCRRARLRARMCCGTRRRPLARPLCTRLVD